MGVCAGVKKMLHWLLASSGSLVGSSLYFAPYFCMIRAGPHYLALLENQA